MSLQQLREVKDFSIKNQHGRIDFLEQVDLVQVDLGKDVTIRPDCIELYESEGNTNK